MFQLPTYAPDLNPQEGVWSLVKRDLGNLAAGDLGQITQASSASSRCCSTGPTSLTAASAAPVWTSTAGPGRAARNSVAALRPNPARPCRMCQKKCRSSVREVMEGTSETAESRHSARPA
ncbi:hypothetical protein ABZ027_04615 [Streptomyces sp. NPDC006332]|uniref:hypothetical protein n=1 Tax=Streptomyces sp. NPDC006332 TaxID=3155456 RepID=UPI0033A16303